VLVAVTVTVTTWTVVMIMIVVVLGGDVVRRLGAAFAPEELLELGHPNALTLFTRHVETVFIDQHLRVLEPLAPGRLGYGIEDLLAELALERRLLETLGDLTQLDALNGSRHEADNLAAGQPLVNQEGAP